MKSLKKILAISLALVLSLSALSIVAFAAPADVPAHITVDVIATKTGEVTTLGDPIYEIAVYLDSTHALQSFSMRICYEKDYFYAVNTRNKAKLANVNQFAYLRDVANDDVFSSKSTLYDETSLSNGFYEGPEVNQGFGYAMFPSNMKYLPSTEADTLLPNAQGFTTQWMADQADNYLILSGGKASGDMRSPTRGRVRVMTGWIAPYSTTPNGSYTIGFLPGQDGKLGAGFDKTDSPDSRTMGSVLENCRDFRSDEITLNSATITIGEPAAQSNVSYLKDQVMFNKKGTEFAGTFNVRTCAAIPATVQQSSITKAGFVFVKNNAMDIAKAKTDVEAAIKADSAFGTQTANGYTFAPVNYIQTGADNYMFTCVVENINTRQGDFKTLAYAEIDGKLEFFDAVQTANLDTLFTTKWAPAAQKYGWNLTPPTLPIA